MIGKINSRWDLRQKDRAGFDGGGKGEKADENYFVMFSTSSVASVFLFGNRGLLCLNYRPDMRNQIL